jgi:Rieske Fe-S protein
MALPMLKIGQGAVVQAGNEQVAVFNDKGVVKAASAKCTHLGCSVQWDEKDASFYCPCHGSRFHGDFSVKNGPAERPLEAREVPQEQPQAAAKP